MKRIVLLGFLAVIFFSTTGVVWGYSGNTVSAPTSKPEVLGVIEDDSSGGSTSDDLVTLAVLGGIGYMGWKAIKKAWVGVRGIAKGDATKEVDGDEEN